MASVRDDASRSARIESGRVSFAAASRHLVATDRAEPEIGAVVAWVPPPLTGNPTRAVVGNDAGHLAADAHTYRSEICLPPHLDGSAERGAGMAGLALADAWILSAGSVSHAECRHFFPSAVG